MYIEYKYFHWRKYTVSFFFTVHTSAALLAFSEYHKRNGSRFYSGFTALSAQFDLIYYLFTVQMYFSYIVQPQNTDAWWLNA
jgi:hypothetical protein